MATAAPRNPGWIVGGRPPREPATRCEANSACATANVARTYREAGFVIIVQDVIIGEYLRSMVASFGEPAHVTVLDPAPEAIAAHEAVRTKGSYGTCTIAALVNGLRRETPCLGQWLHTSALTVEQTVTAILG